MHIENIKTDLEIIIYKLNNSKVQIKMLRQSIMGLKISKYVV